MSLASRLRSSPRRTPVIFFTIAWLGLAASIALTLVAALNKPPLVVSKALHQRHGLTDAVQVTVRNRSSHTTYCPVVSIAALNRSSLDIERLTATPVEGNGSIQPGDTVGYRVVFTKLTQKDYSENLSQFQGFVKKENPCDGG
jgi:hypothetical protein